MDTIVSTSQPNTDTQADLENLRAMDKQLDILIEVSKVQELAEKIESQGTPEMKARLQPFKDHYDGDVVTLVKKRTKQNYDMDVWSDIEKAGEEAKARYQQDPAGYLTEEQKEDYWQKAYDKTISEARELARNFEQALQGDQ